MPIPFPRIGAIAGLGLYAASLCFPVFVCRGAEGPMGYEVAWAGWMAVLAFDPRWFANFFAFSILLAIARTRSLRHIVLYSALAWAFALSCLVIPAMACGSGAGGPEASQGLQLGGYLWIASMSVLSLCGFCWRRAVPKKNG